MYFNKSHLDTLSQKKEKFFSDWKRNCTQNLLIDSEMRITKSNIRESYKKDKSKNGVPSVLVHHPINVIIRKNIYPFYIDQKMVLLFSARNLNNYLAWIKLYPLERKVGPYKFCCNRCHVCRGITETDMFICNNKGPIKSTTVLTVMKSFSFVY